TNAGNAFRIQQYNNSSDQACLNITFFGIASQAICPEFTGVVSGPSTNSDDNGVSCPPGVPACPPENGGDALGSPYYEFFGFAVLDSPGSPCIESSCTVTSAADDGGSGTLRAAIKYANAHTGTTIRFAPALAGSTITLTSELPLLTGGLPG